MYPHKFRIRRNRRLGSSIAEFGAAFYAFFFAIIIPTINLLSFAVAFSYAHISANMKADSVAQSMTLKRARQIVEEAPSSLKSEPLASFLKAEPGPDGFKLDLVKTNLQGESEIVTAKTLNSLNDERTNGLIQYRVTANYSLQPRLDLSAVPFINNIPIIGKASEITFKLNRNIEHADEMMN
jgi:hypothetical protein